MAPTAGPACPRHALIALAVTFLFLSSSAAQAQRRASPFVAPPRTIADITAILDQEKPDPKLLAKLHAEAEAEPPQGASRRTLALFYFQRAQARTEIGRTRDGASDSERAIELGRGQDVDVGRFRQLLQSQYNYLGDPKRRLQILMVLARDYESMGRRHSVYRQLAETFIQLGDLKQAEAYVRINQAKFGESRSFGRFYDSRSGWEANVLQGNARLLEVRGQFREAEPIYRRAQALYRDSWAKWTLERDGGLLRSGLELQVDVMLAFEGRVKARQGRFAEAEADVRRALLSRLKAAGKYHLYTAQMINFLAQIIAEQGRFEEAERLVRTEIEIYQSLGIDADSQSLASVWSRLASVLNLAGKWGEASQAFSKLDEVTRTWEPSRREALTLNINQITTLYNTNNLPAGIAASERLLARQRGLYGDQNVETALARGMLAIGLAKTRRDAEAMREFRLAIPILVSSWRETDSESAIAAAAREQRVQIVIEAYIAWLSLKTDAPESITALETFHLADVIRGRSVQKALAASSARMVARDPALAELARKEQDLEKQVAAQLGVLNNALALPPEQRDDKAVRELTAEIDKLRSARGAARKDIEKRFPSYADLIDPKAPTVEDIRAVLSPEEAFLSYYLGRETSFVWVVAKTGAVAFAAIGANAGEIEAKVRKLREELDAEAETVDQVPPFDLVLAHELYALLMKPVEQVWRPAKSLIVATNGALGFLPLGLLPTAIGTLPSETDALPFASYRSVPWLARTHAVSMVPSAAALRTLRQLPQGSDKRERLIGFGDPLFAPEQVTQTQQLADAGEQASAATARGLPLRRRAESRTSQADSAELAQLPRLPDTADELRSVALALEVDPAKVLNLGKDANERKVKGTDLSRYRIVAFATHGLVAGDLNGLTQPALALTAPEIADIDGDGLLTMEEVLALKLDADWVVLSACNTGAGAGAGAEAVSGLGRAFFYAGTRTLLVTNWSVHSASARELVTDIFRRQASDPMLTRAEALRQAMMGLMDGPGSIADSGKPLFTYAHPLFWAPYSIIGDGAR